MICCDTSDDISCVDTVCANLRRQEGCLGAGRPIPNVTPRVPAEPSRNSRRRPPAERSLKTSEWGNLPAVRLPHICAIEFKIPWTTVKKGTPIFFAVAFSTSVTLLLNSIGISQPPPVPQTGSFPPDFGSVGRARYTSHPPL